MKLPLIGLLAALAATGAQAKESYCIYPSILGLIEVINTNDVLINEINGRVLFRVEQLSSDMYLLKEGDVETAFRSKPSEFGYYLNQVGAEDVAIACFDDAEKRAETLAKLEAAQAEADRKYEAEVEAQRAEDGKIAYEAASYVSAKVQENWRIPSTARNGMSAVVAINLFPSGDIDQAYIESSSGDQAFDRSALKAVFRAEPFQSIADIDPIIFERSLRRLLITFRPEGLRW